MTVQTPDPTRVADHYGKSGLGDRILAALAVAGKDLARLTVEDLAPVDGFHVRGRAATEELAALVRLGPSDEVLDVGCGLGGTARYLAAATGCRAVGIDLTAEYCRIATDLSARVGLEHRTEFLQGSALELPFEDGRFDVVWTEHVQMNVADKRAFYGELARVLKPGGTLAFHDIFAGKNRETLFPVPWAEETSISHLVPADDLPALLEEVGLERVSWQDETAQARAFFEDAVERMASGVRPPLGLHLLMGATAQQKFANMLRNLERDCVRIIKAVVRRAI